MNRLQLDPTVQTVWATPTKLRFGIDRELAMLDNPPPRVERLVSALRAGMPTARFDQIAFALGVNRAEREALLTALDPVLLRDGCAAEKTRYAIDEGHPLGSAHLDEQAERLSVHLSGDPKIVSVLQSALSAEGHGRSQDAPAEVAVLVSHFVTSLRQARGWLTLGIPHLPVVFSEREVRIGPLVSGHGNPCLFCVACHRVDAEPEWVAIASQCIGRRAAAATSGMIFSAAALVSHVLTAWRTGGRGYSTTQLVLTSDAEIGYSVTANEISSHPRCGCHSLADAP